MNTPKPILHLFQINIEQLEAERRKSIRLIFRGVINCHHQPRVMIKMHINLN